MFYIYILKLQVHSKQSTNIRVLQIGKNLHPAIKSKVHNTQKSYYLLIMCVDAQQQCVAGEASQASLAVGGGTHLLRFLVHLVQFDDRHLKDIAINLKISTHPQIYYINQRGFATISLQWATTYNYDVAKGQTTVKSIQKNGGLLEY